MTRYNKIRPLLLLSALLIINACGTSDTITVVSDGPRSGASPDTAEVSNDDFRQITIGLIEPVTNFDPLFAKNLSTKRVLSLIYQGLYTLNNDGEPKPAIAKNAEISDDGLEYVITINRELFYHESSAFSAGVGRRIHANDIKWALERTARSNVPPYASNLLMNIEGYTNFFIEQRNEYDSSKRALDGVSGIEVINPETISITLKKPDPDFLKKLASPYLFIYPREAAERGERGIKTTPVGTGSYKFRSMEDRRIILSRHDAATDPLPGINRIDFVYRTNESDLFQDFARNRIDWIPETGPQINRQILTEQMELISPYRDQYHLVENRAHRISAFYVNPESESNLEWLKNRLSEAAYANFDIRGTLNFGDLSLSEADDITADDEYYIMSTDNPVARSVFEQLNSSLIEPESSLSYLDIRVVIPQTTLFSGVTDSFHKPFMLPGNYWLSAETPIFSLHHPHLSGIQNSNVPWLLFIESIRLRGSDREPS